LIFLQLEGWKLLQQFGHLYVYSHFVENWFGEDPEQFVTPAFRKAHPDTLLVHANPNSLVRAKAIERARNLEKISSARKYIYMPENAPGEPVCIPNILTANFSRYMEYLQSKNFTIGWIHMPKAAGTSVLSYISTQKQAPYLHTENLNLWKTMQPMQRNQLRFLIGENLIRAQIENDFQPPLSQLSRPIAYITFLRDPVARIISHFNYIKNATWEPTYRVYSNMTFQQFVVSTPNLYAYLLGFPRNANLWDQEMIRGHIMRLLTLVLITENYTLSMVLANRILHLPPPQPHNSFANPSQLWYYPTPTEITLIKKVNKLDIIIYQIACEIFQEQVRYALLKLGGLDAYLLQNVKEFQSLSLWERAYWSEAILLRASELVLADCILLPTHMAANSSVNSALPLMKPFIIGVVLPRTLIRALRGIDRDCAVILSPSTAMAWKNSITDSQAKHRLVIGDLLAQHLQNNLLSNAISKEMRIALILLVYDPVAYIWVKWKLASARAAAVGRYLSFMEWNSEPANHNPQSQEIWGSNMPSDIENEHVILLHELVAKLIPVNSTHELSAVLHSLAFMVPAANTCSQLRLDIPDELAQPSFSALELQLIREMHSRDFALYDTATQQWQNDLEKWRDCLLLQ
jgi:hypothetical protein